MDKFLWEILVPTIHSNGRPIRTRYHKVWDEKVRAIAGGLSIMKPLIGQWVNPDNALFCERMIPVRVGCTEDAINRIADMTAKYYDQQAVMFYAISSKWIIKHYEPRSP